VRDTVSHRQHPDTAGG